MDSYHIVMSCRREGAIGIWEERWFLVQSPSGDRDAVLDAWFKAHRDQWEPNNMVSFRKSEAVT